MRALAAAGLFAALLLPPACSPAPAPPAAAEPEPQAGGRFVYPVRAEPSTLDFVAASDVFSALVTRLVGDSLVDLDADLRIVPRLAASWEVSDGGRRLLFHLRQGVRFHDGTPFSAADVVFTWRRILDPARHALAWLDGFLPVESVEAVDPHTVLVRYREPYAPALQAWVVPILPRHVCENDTPAEGRCARAPIGTGPFRFGSWEPGRRIALHANPDYWGGRPHLDAFVFQVIPSQETTLQALLAGEIDYAPLTPVQWDAQAGSAAFARRFESVQFTPLFFYYIAWRGDGSNPFFGEPGVRRALSMAIDREGYVRSVLRGSGRATGSLFHPAVLPARTEEASGDDRAGAARLLEEAGWTIDGGSGLRTRRGVPFRFTLTVFGGGEDHLLFSQVAQESLRRLGVEMRIEKVDWPTLRQKLQSGSFEAALSGMVPGPDPDDMRTVLHSSQIKEGRNYAAFSDSQVDAWLDAARRTLDPDRRRELYLSIDRRTRELQPYSPLFYPIQRAGLSRRFRGVVASPRGIIDHYPGMMRVHALQTAP